MTLHTAGNITVDLHIQEAGVNNPPGVLIKSDVAINDSMLEIFFLILTILLS